MTETELESNNKQSGVLQSAALPTLLITSFFILSCATANEPASVTELIAKANQILDQAPPSVTRPLIWVTPGDRDAILAHRITVASVSGVMTQAYVEFNAGSEPRVQANDPVSLNKEHIE